MATLHPFTISRDTRRSTLTHEDIHLARRLERGWRSRDLNTRVWRDEFSNPRFAQPDLTQGTSLRPAVSADDRHPRPESSNMFVMEDLLVAAPPQPLPSAPPQTRSSSSQYDKGKDSTNITSDGLSAASANPFAQSAFNRRLWNGDLVTFEQKTRHNPLMAPSRTSVAAPPPAAAAAANAPHPLWYRTSGLPGVW